MRRYCQLAEGGCISCHHAHSLLCYSSGVYRGEWTQLASKLWAQGEENYTLKGEEFIQFLFTKSETLRHIRVTEFYVQFLSYFMFCHISQFRAMFYVHRSPHSRTGRLNAATAKLQSPKSGCNRFL